MIYFELHFFSVTYLTVVIYSGLESRFVDRSQLGPNISSGSSPCTGLLVVTLPTHLLKDCSLLILSQFKITDQLLF